MRQVERHIIRQGHKHWEEIDNLAFLSKNLYNLANYHCRQHFFATKRSLSLADLYHQVKQTEAYRTLPTKVSKQIIRKLVQNWTAYFEAIKEYRVNPSRFNALPRIPKYKHKTKGRNILIYPETAYFKKELKKGIIKLSTCNITVPTKLRKIDEVRIVPATNCYIIEVIYEKEETTISTLNPSLVAGIDLGVNNLAAVTSNKKGFQTFVVNGKPLKSINQGYNKRRSQLQSLLDKKTCGKQKHSRQLDKLTFRRNCRVENYLHHASRLIVNKLVKEGIGTLIIGKNNGWKQDCNMGRINNQKFVCIPHAKLIEKLTYKAHLVGIQVIVTEESYTSKASALDLDELPTYSDSVKRSYSDSEALATQGASERASAYTLRDASLRATQGASEQASALAMLGASGEEVNYKFSGKRLTKKRGLYQSKNKHLVNSDCNGSINIIRKVIPNAFAEGIEVSAVIPVRLNPLQIARAT